MQLTNSKNRRGGGKKPQKSRHQHLQQPTERDGDFWHQSAFCRAVIGSTKIRLTGFHTACELYPAQRPLLG